MASLSLHQISGNTYFMPSPTNIGLYVRRDRAVLIDSGNDKEAGRQILRLLNDRNWTLEMIINTHSNADHIGGNSFLQKKTNCRIGATGLESAFIQNPILEPAFLLGGFPFIDLQNKFLMAQPSSVTDIISSSGKILHTDLEAIPLPGHFFDMIGIRTPDNVVFIADSLFPENIISKYHIFFLLDVRAQFVTIHTLQNIQAAYFVPSHGDPSKDISALIKLNKRQIYEILHTIKTICKKPSSFEEILSAFCVKYEIKLDSHQYVLVISTLKSYLTYLKDEGSVEAVFEDGKLLWKSGD